MLRPSAEFAAVDTGRFLDPEVTSLPYIQRYG
jgi:hypothetical protein